MLGFFLKKKAVLRLINTISLVRWKEKTLSTTRVEFFMFTNIQIYHGVSYTEVSLCEVYDWQGPVLVERM